MDDDLLVDEVEAYVMNEGGAVPKLVDLPARWDRQSDEIGRAFLLYQYLVDAEDKRWAWDGLKLLLNALIERGQPIPDDLTRWALAAFTSRIKPPRKPGNPRYARKYDRNQRIAEMYAFLIDKGMKQEDVEDKLRTALGDHCSDDTIGRIFKQLDLKRRLPDHNAGATIANT